MKIAKETKEPEACPFCGWFDPDLWEYKDGVNETACACCGRSIVVKIEVLPG